MSVPKYLADPTEAQKSAWHDLNTAFGSLALAYAINMDSLAESCGTYTEEIVSVLLDDGRPAA